MYKIAHLLRVPKFSSSFHTSPLRLDGKNVVPKSSPDTSSPPPPKANVDLGKDFFTPNAMDKFILVWAKKYKSKEEVPNLVPASLYNHARNVARIKLANYTMVLIILGCCFSVWYGKLQAKRGNTLQKRALEWHEQLKAEHEREMQEKNSAPGKS